MQGIRYLAYNAWFICLQESGLIVPEYRLIISVGYFD